MTESDAVAVVGVSCRLPGSPDPDAFWRLLADGSSAVTAVPGDRWDSARFTAADGLGGVAYGAFLDTIDSFDPAFFSLSPAETVAVDPQQRLMLELAWEALEDFRTAPTALCARPAGVFVGVASDDYAILARGGGTGAVTRHTATGLTRGLIANRISHFLGLTGPSITVDSAQSSSLVAVHLACESLRGGESEIALAGGVQLNLAPDGAVGMARLGVLSPDGHCAPFDSSANGTVRGEGGVVLVLKPLSRALADGDRIRAVILGSAVNHDGGGGLTVPDAAAQEAVIRAALERSGVSADDVDYVEVHGTGTTVGDRVEAVALGTVFENRASAVSIGSVKPNIGHLGAAAGIAGLLKVVLSIGRGELPATVNVTTPAPELDLPARNLAILTSTAVTTTVRWPGLDTRRVAGVSSFGIGGTNCHVVLCAPPPTMEAAETAEAGETAEIPRADQIAPVILSARSPEALRAQAARWAEFVRSRPGARLVDVGWSSVVSRSVFEHRAVLVAADRGELAAGLDALAHRLVLPAARAVDMAVVFSGQGGQRLGMGRQLCDRFPVFAAAFEDACAAVEGAAAELGMPAVDVRDVVFGADAGALERTGAAQLALFAVEVALFRLLESWGVRPGVVAGHSVGEFAAAHVAGVFSLADAALLVAARAGLMQALPAGGAMVAVAAPEGEIAGDLAGAVGVEAAAVNGPRSVVVSGEEPEVLRLAAVWRGRGLRTSRLRVSHAFHSALMEPALPPFRKVAARVAPRAEAPGVPLVSTQTGRLATLDELGSPDYWVRQVRQTVRFADAVATMDARSPRPTVFVEVGPDAVLTPMVGECVPAGVAVATSRRGRPEVAALLAGLGRAYSHGVSVDWAAVFAGAGARTVDLPTYAFQRRRYWLDMPPAAGGTHDLHDLAGVPEAGVPEADVSRIAPPEADVPRSLKGMAEGERRQWLLGLVRDQVAVVLGHGSGHDVDVERAFTELGFDSVAAVELRNWLGVVTGVRLHDTLTFDYPTPAAVVEHLLVKLLPEGKHREVPALAELDRLEATLAAPIGREEQHIEITRRLQDLLASWVKRHRAAPDAAAQDTNADRVLSASDDELFDLVDNDLAIS